MANLLAESNFVIKWLELSRSFELRACSNTKYELFVYRIHMYTFASYWYIFVLREYQHWEELLLLKFDLTDSKTSPRSFCLAKVEKRRTCESCKTVVIWVSSSGTLLRRNFISSQTSTFPYFCHHPPPPPSTPIHEFCHVSHLSGNIFLQQPLFSRNSHHSLRHGKGKRGGMRKIQSFCAECNCPGMSYHNDNNDNFISNFSTLRVFVHFFFLTPSRLPLQPPLEGKNFYPECIFAFQNFCSRLSQINVRSRLKFSNEGNVETRIWCTFCHPPSGESDERQFVYAI